MSWGRLRILVGAAVVLLVVPVAARAATITVTTTADDIQVDGNCSLREATIAANTDTAVDACRAGSGADTIVIPAGTYYISPPSGLDGARSGDFNLTAPVTLKGAGAASTIIDGRQSAGGTPLDRLIHITSGGSYTISGVTLQNGKANGGGALAIDDGTGSSVTLSHVVVAGSSSSSSGGGIYNGSTLTVLSSTISGNGPASSGGGIYNGSTLSVLSSTISGNSASLAGGGLDNEGTASATSTNFTSNIAQQKVGTTGGGAIYNLGALTLSHCNVLSNSASGPGGGILSGSGAAPMSIDSSTISGNSAPVQNGGGIMSFVPLTLTNSTVSNNTAGGGAGDGGGVDLNVTASDAPASTLSGDKITGNTASNALGGGLDLNTVTATTVTRTTISNNSAGEGGGIFAAGQVTATGITVSGNSAVFSSGGQGGGIWTEASQFTLTDSTLANNTAPDNGSQGGGIYLSSGTLSLLNDTLSLNSATATGGGGDFYGAGGSATTQDTVFYGDDDCEGILPTSTGHNLVNVPENCFANADPTNLAVANPKLGSLGGHGGPTQTIPLATGSPALDAGANCASTDQRGVPRPGSTLESGETAGSACDIGAYERAACLGVLVNIVGTPGDDTIKGTSGADGILALGGNDTINPGAGSDGVCAGAGNDSVALADGIKDFADGGPGTDTVSSHDAGLDVLANFEVISG